MTEKRYAKWMRYQQRCIERRRAWENGETAPETPSQPAASSATSERTAGSEGRSVRERSPTPRPREERRRAILRPNPEVVVYDPETAVRSERRRDDGSPDRSPERSPSPGKGEQKGGKGKKGQKGKKGNSKGKKGGKGKQSGK